MESRDFIAQKLAAISHRIEAIEHAQSENDREISNVAKQIDIAAGEQTGAFDRMAAAVTGLAERLGQMEQRAGKQSEAIGRLQQNMSRIEGERGQAAEQVSSQLAGFARHIGALTAQMEEHRNTASRLTELLEQRTATTEEQTRALQRAQSDGAAVLDRALRELERIRVESTRHHSLLREHIEIVAALAAKVEVIEGRASKDKRGAAALDALQNLMSRVEANMNDDRQTIRLETVERSLFGVASRIRTLEDGPRRQAEAEKHIHDLALHLELAQKHNRKTTGELRSMVESLAQGLAEIAKTLAETSAQVRQIASFPLSSAPPPIRDSTAAPALVSGPPEFLPAASSSSPAAGATADTHKRESQQRNGGAARPKASQTRRALAGTVMLLTIIAAPAGVLFQQTLDSTIGDHGVLSRPLNAAHRPRNAQALAISQWPRKESPTVLASRPLHILLFAQRSPESLVGLARGGNSKAELILGLKYLEGKGVAADEAEAARWLTRAAEHGDALAQYRLGTLYEHGRGLPADGEQAARWYELAAQQGNRKAMHNLAVAYAEGSGETKDYTRAAFWFAKAAALGFADSQFNLGVLYERGMGVKQNLAKAYKWYAIAAAQDDIESKARLDVLVSELNPADRINAQAAAAAFKPERPNAAANAVPTLG